MSAQRRTAAVTPPAGYSRPAGLVPGTLRVTYQTEDGANTTYDFGAINYGSYDPAPAEVVEPLAAAFAKVSGPSGSWNRDSTVQAGWETVKRFLRFVAEHWNVAAVTDLSADIWAAWVDHTTTPSGNATAAYNMRTLLQAVEGLPAEARWALNRPLPKPAARKVIAYSPGEMARIVRAARLTVDVAAARVGGNLRARDLWRAGTEPPDAARVRLMDKKVWSHGEVADHLSRTARMPPGFKTTPAVRSSVLREALGLDPAAQAFRVALFPATHEIFAAMILLAHAKGLNASVMARICLGDIRRQPGRKPGSVIYSVAVTKPRSPRPRTVTFSGSSARLLERILAMTQPARDTLTTLGYPEDHLLVAVFTRDDDSRNGSGMFATDWRDARGAAGVWHKRSPVHDEYGKPISVSLQRMRLSVQVVREEAMGNSLEVSVNVYRGPDPQTHAKAQPVVMQGLHDALDDAQRRAAALISESEAEAARADPVTLATRLGISREDAVALIDGGLDTATAACRDIMHSPHPDDGGGPCTASWLTCVECPNAVVAPDHIPRIVATRDALAEAATSSASPVRVRGYARHVAAFDELLSHVPAPELRRARAMVTSADVERATRLLSRKLDR